MRPSRELPACKKSLQLRRPEYSLRLLLALQRRSQSSVMQGVPVDQRPVPVLDSLISLIKPGALTSTGLLSNYRWMESKSRKSKMLIRKKRTSRCWSGRMGLSRLGSVFNGALPRRIPWFDWKYCIDQLPLRCGKDRKLRNEFTFINADLACPNSAGQNGCHSALVAWSVAPTRSVSLCWMLSTPRLTLCDAPSVLLCLAVQAGNFPGSGTTAVAQEELEALWTNVKVILAGLQAYGQMWDGIDLMACKSRKTPDSCIYTHRRCNCESSRG